MRIPPRLVRDEIAHLAPRRFLTLAEEELEARLRRIGQALFLKFGRAPFTTTGLAEAAGITPRRFRRFFADPDDLLAQLLRAHLNQLARAIGTVPHAAENRPLAAAHAYFTATRDPEGHFTPEHALYVRDRDTMPPDLLPSLAMLRQSLALAMHLPPEILDILDLPWLTQDRIEAALAAFAPAAVRSAANPPSPRPPARAIFCPAAQAAPPEATRAIVLRPRPKGRGPPLH